MSAWHTPRRLVLTSQDDYPTGCANFEGYTGVDVVVLYHDNAKVDARRLVACWNACEGIPTEALEVSPNLEDVWNCVVAQRDELLAALESVLLWMGSQADAQSKGGHATFDLMMLREQRDIAHAAIAKVKGGSA